MWKHVTVSLLIVVACISFAGCSAIKDILKYVPITGISIGADTTVVTYAEQST